MTIYFDINEQPYNTPVEGYIASCTDSRWAYYSQLQNRDINSVIEELEEKVKIFIRDGRL